jgi:hypothetical protein
MPRSRTSDAATSAGLSMANVIVRPANPRPRHHARIVPVGDQQALWTGVLEDLRLGVGNRIDRCEVLEVRFTHVGPHAHVRLGNLDQRSDFPGRAHPQFHHGHVGRVHHLQQRERDPDVVVQVAPVPEGAESQRQERGRHFFRRRLPRRARDRNDAGARLAPHLVRDPLQAPRRIGHRDDSDRLPVRSSRCREGCLAHEQARGPLCHGLGDERVAIEPRAANRHEELAWLHATRVDPERRETPTGIALNQAAARGTGDLARGQPQQGFTAHDARRSPRRPASAASATCTSSNGLVRSPTT